MIFTVKCPEKTSNKRARDNVVNARTETESREDLPESARWRWVTHNHESDKVWDPHQAAARAAPLLSQFIAAYCLFESNKGARAPSMCHTIARALILKKLKSPQSEFHSLSLSLLTFREFRLRRGPRARWEKNPKIFLIRGSKPVHAPSVCFFACFFFSSSSTHFAREQQISQKKLRTWERARERFGYYTS